MNTLKKCFKCRKEKDLNLFYKHKEMKNGHLNKCIECVKEDSIIHRQKNLSKIREYDVLRSRLPHRIAGRKKYFKKYIKQHPDRRAANIILGNAIRSGRIKKQPCERCSSTVNIHGHHEDYTKPLDVNWLCPLCHSQLHKTKRGDK